MVFGLINNDAVIFFRIAINPSSVKFRRVDDLADLKLQK
jgi:hypothetical protein